MTDHERIRWTLQWLVTEGYLTPAEARSVEQRLGLETGSPLPALEGEEALLEPCSLEDGCSQELEAEIERSGAFERARHTALKARLQRELERAKAPGLLAELLAISEGKRAEILPREPRFHSRGLAELLLREVRAAWHKDLAKAEHFVDLCLLLVEELASRGYSRDVIANLGARSWAYRGNLHRLANRWSEAESAFQESERRWELGQRDTMTEALILDLKASLLKDQRRLPEASNVLEEAIQRYRDLGETHLAGRSLINLATISKELADLESTIQLLRRALSLIDATEEPQLEMFARHNLMFNLCECGRADEAAALLEEWRPMYLDYPAPSAQLRLRWLEGKIALGTGDLQEAEAALQATQKGFAHEGASYEAAMAALDLAAVYALERRTGDMKRLASELFTTFQSHEIHREALGAIILFRQAADLEQATLGVVEKVAARIERSRYLPDEDPS